MRHAASSATLKVILSASELGSAKTVYAAAATVAMASADFAKTSTGKEASPANLEQGAAICSAIRDHAARTGRRLGLKAAGGIRTAADARDWIGVATSVLGSDWLQPATFRIGASSLLDALLAER